MFGLGQKQMVIGPGQVPPAGYGYVGSYQDGSGATVDLYQERITAVATAGVPAQPVTAQPTQPAQPAQPPAQPAIAQTPEERTIAAAANGNGAALLAVRTARVVFNSDQWNYYRSAGGGDVPNVDLFPPGNRDYQMTIDEYLQARAAHGLTGLGGGLGRGFLDLSRMVAVNPWIT